MIKFLAGMLVAFSLVAGISFARADECKTLEAFVAQTGAVSSYPKITDEQKSELIRKKGPPPVDDDFDAYILSNEAGDVEILAIVVDGCVRGMLGPLPTTVLNEIFNVTQAIDKPKGERID